MKTLEQTLDAFESRTLDGRDAVRLARFCAADQLTRIGMALVEGAEHQQIEWTRDNILKQLQQDVDFGFEKALNKRGISSSFMFETVRMWNAILEEGLETWPAEEYAMYGLPLFKATAVKYGWENPIGDDKGTEDYYNC